MHVLKKSPKAWLPLTRANWPWLLPRSVSHAELAGARDEGQKRIADAEKRAQMVADEIKANANAEAGRIIAQAKADAEQQVTKAREELRAQVAGLAVKGAEQILKREVNASAHADLLTQLATEL